MISARFFTLAALALTVSTYICSSERDESAHDHRDQQVIEKIDNALPETDLSDWPYGCVPFEKSSEQEEKDQYVGWKY